MTSFGPTPRHDVLPFALPSSKMDEKMSEKNLSRTSVHVASASATLAGKRSNESIDDPSKSDEDVKSMAVERTREEILKELQEEWDADPRNPRNWPKSKKWLTVCIVSFYTFVTPVASSMMAPALPNIARELNITSPTVLALTLSIFLLAIAISPLVLGPLSEIYGRTWIYHLSNLVFLTFNIGCAFSKSAGALIGFRFLAGISGSAPVSIGGSSVGDMFNERERAGAMAVWTLGPLIGPVVGPIAGGYIAQSVGFKYVFLTIVGLSGVAAIVALPFLRETYAPVLRERIARALPDVERARYEVILEKKGTPWDILKVSLTRPIMMLSRSVVCFVLSLYLAFSYAVYYLMFTVFPDLFMTKYGFSTGSTGLTYSGLGIGFFLGSSVGGKLMDKLYGKLADRNGGKGTPEMRLPLLIFGSLFVPVGLFWYGWSAQAGVHWIVPIIGTGVFGFGFILTVLPAQVYLIDIFAYSASALSAATVFRSILGFAFPLFGAQLYEKLDYGPGTSLLAGLAIVIGIPFPIWLYFNGEKLRARGGDLFR